MNKNLPPEEPLPIGLIIFLIILLMIMIWVIPAKIYFTIGLFNFILNFKRSKKWLDRLLLFINWPFDFLNTLLLCFLPEENKNGN